MGSATTRGLALVLGEHTGFIDHLMPLVFLLDLALLTNNAEFALYAELLYPEANVIHTDEPLEYIQHYELFVYAEPSRLAHGGFLWDETLYKGKARSICSLHGNSDKSRSRFWAERYADENCVLLYGPHMRDFFAEKGVLNRIEEVIFTGNYRYLYYQHHKAFFDSKVKALVAPRSGRRRLLYAPTWHEQNPHNPDRSSFFEVSYQLFETIPREYELLVKLHPYLWKLYPQEIERLYARYRGNDQIHFLSDHPLVYPILDQVEGYIGDYSSIGYDFLALDRPLFFFKPNSDVTIADQWLHRVGSYIDPDQSLYQRIDHFMNHDDKQEERKALYQYSFGDELPLMDLKKSLLEVLESMDAR